MPGKHISDLPPIERDLLTRSVVWMDSFWDEAAGLLKVPTDDRRFKHIPEIHDIRTSTWYALGLCQRGSEDDLRRVQVILETILQYQFNEPGKPYDGTWYRFTEEPPPGDQAIWRGYDPNWREFIGTTLALILLDFEQDIPASLIPSIDSAFRLAIRGGMARGLTPAYTNIALMHAFLLIYVGERLAEPAWIVAGEEYAREIYRLFARHGTFSEYNSPTYYGVDLYALGLWRTYSSSPLLKQPGAEMEAALWRDTALFYHAGMKNVAGPYDRSYGMDMQHYASLIGLWIWQALGRDQAPFPDTDHPFEHALDFAFVPLYVAVGVDVPASVLPTLRSFQGPRQIERLIDSDPRRVVTAWIGKNLLIGGEETSYSYPASDQIHPATIHWQHPNGQIGWIRLMYYTPVNARVEGQVLTITQPAQGPDSPDLHFTLLLPTGDQPNFAADYWQLPNLAVRITTNANFKEARVVGDVWEVRYTIGHLDKGEIASIHLEVKG